MTVKKASELVNNDRIGKSDPYVKIRYSDVEFRSKTIQNTLEPEWNFSCKFDILNLEERYIHINVYDDDFGKDNIEGCYSLSLKEAMSDSAEEGCWYNLVGCKTGKVFICTSFTPIKMEDSSTVKPVQEAKTTDISKDKEVPVLEISENKSESKDTAPDSFINDIYTSVGKQAVPEKETDPSVSKPDDRDTEESVLPSPIKTESTNKIDVPQQEEHSSKLEEKEENSTESILTENSKEPESDSLPSEENNTVNEIQISVEKKELVKSINESEKEQSLVNRVLPEQIVLSKETEAVSSKQEEICSPASEDILIRPGLLKIIVFEASELVNKDMIGKSDPFVKIKFNGQEFKSQKVRNSLNPEWNFSTNLTVKSSDVDSDIVLEVYDDDFGSADFIGSYTLS